MSKKLLLVIILSFVLGSINAQDRKIYFSPYSTWDFSNIPYSADFPHRGKLAIGVGIQSNILISKKIEVIIGAAYLDKGYATNPDDFVVAYPPIFEQIDKRISRWWYAYFSIPVKLQYNFKLKERALYAAAGIENDFNFDGNGHYVFEDFAQSFTVNLGTSIELNRKYNLGIEPTFRQSLQVYGVENGGGVRPDLKPYSIGLKLLLQKKR